MRGLILTGKKFCQNVSSHEGGVTVCEGTRLLLWTHVLIYFTNEYNMYVLIGTVSRTKIVAVTCSLIRHVTNAGFLAVCRKKSKSRKSKNSKRTGNVARLRVVPAYVRNQVQPRM
jgi:hypothetical protein